MSPLQRVLREPNALVGVVIAALGLLALLGVPITKELLGAIIALLGAVVVLLRQLTVPASEVLAQLKPGADTGVAGPASVVPDGTPVEVNVASDLAPGMPAEPPPADER